MPKNIPSPARHRLDGIYAEKWPMRVHAGPHGVRQFFAIMRLREKRNATLHPHIVQFPSGGMGRGTKYGMLNAAHLPDATHRRSVKPVLGGFCDDTRTPVRSSDRLYVDGHATQPASRGSAI
jgi:hypothetical protein